MSLINFLVNRANADTNASNADGLTALHYATHRENVSAVNILTAAAGAAVAAGTVAAGTVAASTVAAGTVTVDANARSKDGSTCMHWAVQSGNFHIAQRLWQVGRADVNVQTHDGLTALHFAVLHEDARMVEMLTLQASCDINILTVDGLSALHIACRRSCLAIARILALHCFCEVNTVTFSEGSSPLQAACQRGAGDIARILLQRGARIDTRTHIELLSPLHAACYHGHDDIVSLLLADEASAVVLDWQAADGYSAVMYTSRNNHFHCLKLLLDRGAVVHHIDSRILGDGEGEGDGHQGAGDDDACVVRSNCRQRRLVDKVGFDGKTALHWACYHGNMPATKLILSSLPPGKCHIDAPDRFGVTPLQKACERGHVEVAKLLYSKYKADPHIRAHDGRTAAEIAAKNCLLELLMLF